MQALWRWLWNSDHSIAKNDRKTLMLLFREMVYSGKGFTRFEEIFKTRLLDIALE